jgi:hypothetical protein
VSLRARLTLYCVATVVLPVAAVSAYGWRAVSRAADRQLRSELDLGRRSATLVLAAQLGQATDTVLSIANDPPRSGRWPRGTRRGSRPCSTARARPTCCWP